MTMTTPTTETGIVEKVARAIEDARCVGREGPFGGYDYGFDTDFYGPAPEGGRYVIRDFRDPASPDWGKWLHQTDDREEHEALFEKMTREHAARAAIAAMPDPTQPLDIILFCPKCGLQHVDAPDERTPDWTNPPHKSHLCHGCGRIWRPADAPTNGVAAIQSRGSKDTVFYNAAAPATAPDSTQLLQTMAGAWQPIETAPKDRWILGWDAEGGHGLIRHNELFALAGEDADGWMGATHWQPLPEPPAQFRAQEQRS